MPILNFFQNLLLPTCIIGILLILGVTLLLTKHKKSGLVIVIVGASMYYLFSVNPVSDAILRPLENEYTRPTKISSSVDKIVVLLGGSKQIAIDGISTMGESTLFRAIEASSLYFSLQQPTIILSGADPIDPSAPTTAEIYKLLMQYGIPSSKIVLETLSLDTYENARNVLEIVGNNEPFLLVTSAYHMPRAMVIFKKLGANPIPYPVDYRASDRYSILDFLPGARSLQEANWAFHEYFGLIYYRIVH